MVRHLWFGITPPPQQLQDKEECTHFPLIKTSPIPLDHPSLQSAFKQWDKFTHLIITSKEAARYLFNALIAYGYPLASLKDKQLIATGKGSAALFTHLMGEAQISIAELEQAEGVCLLLDNILLNQTTLTKSYFFWPHAQKARPLISNHLIDRKARFIELILYTTHTTSTSKPPQLADFDKITFTSPSTVDAFIELYGQLPCNKELFAIGPITAAKIKEHQS